MIDSEPEEQQVSTATRLLASVLLPRIDNERPDELRSSGQGQSGPRMRKEGHLSPMFNRN